MIDLNELKKQCLKIKWKRIDNGAKIERDSLRHCAMEILEAVEAKTNLMCAETNYQYETRLSDYAEELADVIICALIAAADDNIDIEKAIIGKIEKNRQRAELKGDKL